MFGVDSAEVEPDTVVYLDEYLSITTWDVDEAYRGLPLTQMIVMARWLRERAHFAVSFLGLERATEAQLDELAAVFAPYALHILRVVSSRFEDGTQWIAALNSLPFSLHRNPRTRCARRKGWTPRPLEPGRSSPVRRIRSCYPRPITESATAETRIST